MQVLNDNWYRHIWTLDIIDQSWVEHTAREVDFLVNKLRLRGGEHILDLACGFGRHSLELARRGFHVTGVDITAAYIEQARQTAAREALHAEFLHADIREVKLDACFDVVLNMADGAVGYLENDAENEKIFDIVAAALKPGGQHFMDVVSGDHAARHFPKRHWEAGENTLSLALFDWDPQTRRMLYGSHELPYGQPLQKPAEPTRAAIRLYTLDELTHLLARRGLHVAAAWSTYEGKPVTDRELQLMVHSRKHP